MARMPLAERRRLLVEAAISVISEHGVPAATTRAIVARAEMPLASFHYAFDSHSALMAEAMRTVIETEGEDAATSLPQGASLSDTVAAGLHRYIDGLVRDQARQQVVLELTHYCLRTPGQQHLATEQQAVARMVAGRLFRAYADATGIRWNVPLEQLATQLIILTDGLTMAYIIDRDEVTLRALVPGLARGFDGYVAQD